MRSFSPRSPRSSASSSCPKPTSATSRHSDVGCHALRPVQRPPAGCGTPSWSPPRWPRRCSARRRLRHGGNGGAGTGAWQRSEEHTSELQSLMRISYAVFCLKKKTIHEKNTLRQQLTGLQYTTKRVTRTHVQTQVQAHIEHIDHI